MLDKLEVYIDDGIPAVTQEGVEYVRQISPKEAVAIAGMLQESNKRLDKMREGDATRKSFDSAEWRRRLEKIARVAAATQIEGERTA